MATRISPIGRVVGDKYENHFLYWLIDEDKTEYFIVSPAQRLRFGRFVQISDNPIDLKLNLSDIVRVEVKDEAFLHEDLDIYTKKWGKLSLRVNREASEKLKSVTNP